MPAMQQRFDPRELRRVLGSFVTGVTVVTTVDGEGRPHGLTVNSFSSVSLDPPLVLWSQSRTAPSHVVFSGCDRFAVNILADDQIAVSDRFARAAADKFAGIATRPGEGGVPLIEGSAAQLECRRVNAYPGGDHVVFIGQVERIGRSGRAPLVYGGGRYLVAQPHDMGVPAADPWGPTARLQAVRQATRAISELSDELDETLGLGVWGNQGPTIVRWEEASRPVSENLVTGLVLPMLSSATGLAFAAWLPPEVSAPFIEAERLVDDDLHRTLSDIRNQGFASLAGTAHFADLYGVPVSAVSVPVFDGRGTLVLALTALGGAEQLDLRPDGRLVPRLRDCARRLGRRLDGSTP